jgi:biopolymer transport protein ExbD
MLSTPFELHPGLKVDLPSSSSQEVKKEPDNVKIVLTKTGRIFFNGKKVDINRLNKNFSKIKNKKTLVIIEADRFAYHGTVVSIMDIAKKKTV